MSNIADVYKMSHEKLFALLNTRKSGLTGIEAQKRLETYGKNVLTPKQKISPLKLFLKQFANTLTIILLASVLLILCIYFFGGRDTSDLLEAGLISFIILMIAGLSFAQEYKAERAIESLKKLLAYKAKVRRDGVEMEVDVADLVPGDIVILEEGTRVPADIRLLEAYALSIIESALTGESLQVVKITDILTGEKQIADQKNMAFSGTSVSSGRGVGVVVSTGDTTEIGKIATEVAEIEENSTPIQKKLDKIGKFIGFMVLGICVIVFVFIVFFAKDFVSLAFIPRVVQSFIAAVALAVAAIPEGLPAVATITLALGTQRMLKRNALVRRLNAIETLGSTDVICSDKTGTLTKGEMTVTRVCSGKKTFTLAQGEFLLDGKKVSPKQIEEVLMAGVVCNNATSRSEEAFLGDQTEIALLISGAKAGIKAKAVRVLEIPFTSERKMMSVVVKEDSGYVLYTKGAPEVLINHCAKIEEDDKQTAFSAESKNEVQVKTHEFSKESFRVLAFAKKRITAEEFTNIQGNPYSLERDLIFLGLQAMIDPPRQEVPALIQECARAGIRVIMITGDHLETAKAVAKSVGIVGEGVTGDKLGGLTDSEFAKLVRTVNIYARVKPSFKTRIVDILKKEGHVVAMTGDGVNDAPALKKADIGIAMGITGTDVAKEASDMVLLDDRFSTIVAAIEEGRGIYHNIRKFVTYLLACNLGEVMLVFFAVMLFQKLPLTATMILWINVVTDGFPAVAIGIDPAEKEILSYKPKLFQKEIISFRLWVEMLVFGVLLTVGVLGIYLFDLRESVAAAQGAAFTALVIFELVYVFLVRARYKIPFFSNKWVFWSIILTVLVQVGLIYIPFTAQLFEVGRINLYDWVYIFIAGAGIFLFVRVFQNLLDKLLGNEGME